MWSAKVAELAQCSEGTIYTSKYLEGTPYASNCLEGPFTHQFLRGNPVPINLHCTRQIAYSEPGRILMLRGNPLRTNLQGALRPYTVYCLEGTLYAPNCFDHHIADRESCIHYISYREPCTPIYCLEGPCTHQIVSTIILLTGNPVSIIFLTGSPATLSIA
jgi:hypothetical protein